MKYMTNSYYNAGVLMTNMTWTVYLMEYRGKYGWTEDVI